MQKPLTSAWKFRVKFFLTFMDGARVNKQMHEVDASPLRQFASDNRSNICPEAWATLREANFAGHAGSYGDDPWSRMASDQLRELFEVDCDVHFVFSGTAANSLALASLCQGFQSVICHELAHIYTDECGAPGFFTSGLTLSAKSGACGKVPAAVVAEQKNHRPDLRFPPPRALSLTHATEVGTLYTPSEIAELSHHAKSANMRVHMDGARFANAVASAGCSPAAVTWQAGVDVLCFGATKNGISAGEAVIFFDRRLGAEFGYRCKQAGQVASKMRLLTSQWVGLLRDGAWLRHASHANAMAKYLETRFGDVAGVRVVHPVQANAVFVEMPDALLASLRKAGWALPVLAGTGGVRFMCSWDTTESDVDHLLQDVRSILENA